MFTLVPSDFFDPAEERNALAEVADLKDTDKVNHTEITQYGAVLIYKEDEDSSVSSHPMAALLQDLSAITDYNKILASRKADILYLAIAQGKSLLLANEYPARDFTTAEYYIFLAMKSLQLNPEISTICWKGELNAEEEISLCRYFKAVDQI